MFACNVMFSRSVRRPHRRTRVETRCVQNVKVDLPWDYEHGPEIRAELLRHAPPGEGWSVGGYALITEEG